MSPNKREHTWKQLKLIRDEIAIPFKKKYGERKVKMHPGIYLHYDPINPERTGEKLVQFDTMVDLVIRGSDPEELTLETFARVAKDRNYKVSCRGA